MMVPARAVARCPQEMGTRHRTGNHVLKLSAECGILQCLTKTHCYFRPRVHSYVPFDLNPLDSFTARVLYGAPSSLCCPQGRDAPPTATG
jgi:hypothetical protein